MKKKIIFIIIILILLILLFPIPMRLRDGGSIKFKAILYTITKYHKLVPIDSEISYIDGIGIEILGKEVFNSTEENKNKTSNNELSNTEGITTALTLEDEIQNNTIWCGTFQLIWNDLKNDLAKQDIVFTPQLKVVENLNKETFTTNDISDKYYYKKIGTPSITLKEEIENDIKNKFNKTSNILNDFEWDNKDPEDYFLYTMLKKEFEFKKAFEEFGKGTFGNYNNIEFFGIKTDDMEELRKQVKVLYYNSKDDFAIKLKTKQEDEVIICKNPKGNIFNNIFKNIIEQENNYKGSKTLQEGELLKIPNIKLKEKNEFTEIQDKIFTFSNGYPYKIKKALQTIQFELDRKGGKIKSEAGMMVTYESIILEPEEKRKFFVDNTFAIFLIEENKEKPYFAGLIDDITKFQ